MYTCASGSTTKTKQLLFRVSDKLCTWWSCNHLWAAHGRLRAQAGGSYHVTLEHAERATVALVLLQPARALKADGSFGICHPVLPDSTFKIAKNEVQAERTLERAHVQPKHLVLRHGVSSSSSSTRQQKQQSCATSVLERPINRQGINCSTCYAADNIKVVSIMTNVGAHPPA